MSLPAWGEWIEIHVKKATQKTCRSLPAWGEWIEITLAHVPEAMQHVSPRMGRVD